MTRWTILATAVVLSLGFGASAHGAVIVPDVLQPGDPYHLVFVTASTRNAESGDIAAYNAFVQTQAALNPSLTGTDDGVTWRVIGSTEDVHARDNALVEAPVYLLDGTTLIATGFGNLWNNSIANPIILNQFVAAITDFKVFTGTEGDGFGIIEDELGNGEAPSSAAGRANQFNLNWIRMDSPLQGDQGHFYALSEKLTTPIPEPGMLSLLAMGAIGWIGCRRRGQR